MFFVDVFLCVRRGWGGYVECESLDCAACAGDVAAYDVVRYIWLWTVLSSLDVCKKCENR